MHRSHNALLFFSRTPQISRGTVGEPFAALPWDELDALYAALLGDLVETAARLPDVNILLYRNQAEISDDYFNSVRNRIELRPALALPLAEQIQRAVSEAFAADYHRVIVIIENHPAVRAASLRHAIDQLGFEDDCAVVGPTEEGKCYLVGIKSDRSEIFDPAGGDPVDKPNLLMGRLCEADVHLFPIHPLYSLDSASNLARLRTDVEMMRDSNGSVLTRTREIFRVLDRKYRLRKSPR